MNVPKGLSEVTADWLESVLQPSEKFNGVEIESVSCDNIGEGTGILGRLDCLLFRGLLMVISRSLWS